MHAALAEVRNPLSRLRAIRDPMTIVADMLLWRETEELLESRGCLSEIPEAVRVWCINTMMGVVRIGATGTMWQSYDADADYFTLCCMRGAHLPMLLRAILDAGRACWEIQYGDTIEYATHAEWLAAAAKYP